VVTVEAVCLQGKGILEGEAIQAIREPFALLSRDDPDGVQPEQPAEAVRGRD
jgi:hypothetical protein